MWGKTSIKRMVQDHRGSELNIRRLSITAQDRRGVVKVWLISAYPSRTIPRYSIPCRFRRAIKLDSIMWRNLTVVWTVDAVEPDTFSASLVQDFDGVALGERRRWGWRKKQARARHCADTAEGTLRVASFITWLGPFNNSL